jgi:hypothetical protein
MIFKRKKTAEDVLSHRPLWRTITYIVLSIYFVINLGLAWYWSRMPDIFWVEEKPGGAAVVGYSTADTLVRVTETLLDKPGGYLSNDVMPPSVFLDNIPNWEFGVLQQVRDLARVMRNDYSRSQSQSREDPDLSEAEPKIFFDSNSWIFPRTETEYRTAIDGFRNYRDRLGTGGETEAQFFSRADNLREWLAQVEKRLGSLSRKLGDSVAVDVINTDLAGDAAAESSSSLPDRVEVSTSWFELDDIFFEARGTSWALVHFFRAAQFDFAMVLQDKNAEASVRQIIRELEASLQPLRSPMIMNGGGYGLFANHSLVMANYLARANAAVINLRELLDQG